MSNRFNFRILLLQIHEYKRHADSLGLRVVRLPIIEGSCPESLEEMDTILEEMDLTLCKGEGVLAHCRGGKDFFAPQFL
jgi:protein-tyrosine phosphatase